MWKTDGTIANTTLVKDINNTSTANSYPTLSPGFFDTVSTNLIFTADDGIHGSELWTSDGTESNTFLIKDIFAGPGSELSDWNLRTFTTKFKSEEYFFARSTTNNYALWKTTGLPNTTSFVSNITASNGFYPLKIGSSDKYIFTIIAPYNSSGVISNQTDRDSFGARLYAYDGTSDPVLLKKGFSNSFERSNGHNSVSTNNDFYFFIWPYEANGDNGKGMELWTSNGTVSGTSIVKNLYPGQLSGTSYNSYSIRYKGELFFLAYSGYSSTPPVGFENEKFYLWKTDGSADGTVIVQPVPAVERPLVVSNNRLYFIANDVATGSELWVTDGTGQSSHLVKDINTGSRNTDINNLTDLNGTLYFTVTDAGTGSLSLWKTNGTDTGTIRIANHGGQLAVSNSNLYFIENNKIWQSDGTTAGTALMNNTGLEDVKQLSNLVYANGRLFFEGYTYAKGYEVYTSSQSVLAVTLLSFTGRLQNQDALLNWTTENEERNSYFNIQRSINGIDFVTIGKVNAENNTSRHDYNFTDFNITAFKKPKVFYRLQQVDVDGKSNYSNVIVLNLTVEGLLRMAPNPAANYTNIYSSIEMPDAVITVTNITGNLMYSDKQNIHAGSIISIPLSNYAKGVYTVTVDAPHLPRRTFKLFRIE